MQFFTNLYIRKTQLYNVHIVHRVRPRNNGEYWEKTRASRTGWIRTLLLNMYLYLYCWVIMYFVQSSETQLSFVIGHLSWICRIPSTGTGTGRHAGTSYYYTKTRPGLLPNYSVLQYYYITLKWLQSAPTSPTSCSHLDRVPKIVLHGLQSMSNVLGRCKYMWTCANIWAHF